MVIRLMRMVPRGLLILFLAGIFNVPLLIARKIGAFKHLGANINFDR